MANVRFFLMAVYMIFKYSKRFPFAPSFYTRNLSTYVQIKPHFYQMSHFYCWHLQTSSSCFSPTISKWNSHFWFIVIFFFQSQGLQWPVGEGRNVRKWQDRRWSILLWHHRQWSSSKVKYYLWKIFIRILFIKNFH